MATKIAKKKMTCSCCQGQIVPGTPYRVKAGKAVHAVSIECDLNIMFLQASKVEK